MKPKTKFFVANSAMAASLFPCFAVFIYVVSTSDDKGDAAMKAVFTMLLGLGVAYVVALAVAFPAFLWSHSLARLGTDSRFRFSCVEP